MSVDPKVALKDYLVGRVSTKGEQRMKCPLHDDTNPSASVNWEKKVWRCLGCNQAGTLGSLLRKLAAGERAPGTPKRAKPEKAANHNRTPLSSARVAGYHAALMANDERLEYLVDQRMLTEETIERHKIGWDSTFSRGYKLGKRYTIPVYDNTGKLVNIRRYRSAKTQTQKMLNEPDHGTPPRLYPAVPKDAGKVVVFEGELDALVGEQLLAGTGFVSTSGTHGSSTWDPDMTMDLRGKEVWVCYDNDEEGRRGAGKVAAAVLDTVKAVYITKPLSRQDKGDITDWVRDEGGTSHELLDAIAAAERFGVGSDGPNGDKDNEVTYISVHDSLDGRRTGETLGMVATVVGRKDPTYTVPAEIHAVCTQDLGKACQTCPMSTKHYGETVKEISAEDVSAILRFIDVDENKVDRLLKVTLGAPTKCNRVELDVTGVHPVEELIVMPSIDRNSESEQGYTTRRLYNVGTHNTRPNTSVELVGTTVPNPKDGHNEFVTWSVRESLTSLDSYEVTPESIALLEIFKVQGGQRPLDKAREIAEDLSANVTKIIGRERMHMAMDLVFHSILQFTFEGKVISRGWLELLLVGDTRTGKSEAAQKLIEHYNMGHVIGCEGASLAGIVGGVKQVGNSWVTTWGELVLNDRRLCVLDEVSGMSKDIIGKLSDVRTRGIAQITKIDTQQTNARCRLIWISNPRQRLQAEAHAPDGVGVVQTLIGAPEDIARFDLAMSVSMTDVPLSEINNPRRETKPHVYTKDLCRELLLWAWSRKAKDVQITPAANDYIYKMAEKLGQRYVDDPPLIQATNVREKIARMSVALAARVFSTDATGTKVVVKKEHVYDAVDFLNRLYEYDNFGYYRRSQRAHRNREFAHEHRDKALKFLRENMDLVEFLIGRDSFRSQDLEEMVADLERHEAFTIISTLTKWRMVAKEKAQIVLQPELLELLKELEDELNK